MKKHLFLTSTFILICLVSTISTALAVDEEISPFYFDGCSTVPEGTNEDPNLWCDCCLDHDVKYWKGGTFLDRRNADLEFKQCVADMSGSEALGLIYYLGVRIGGAPFYDTEYRWGYGWEYGRGYQSLTDEEEADANLKHEAYLVENPDVCADFN